MPPLGGKLVMVAILAAVDFQIYGKIVVDMNERDIRFCHHYGSNPNAARHAPMVLDCLAI